MSQARSAQARTSAARNAAVVGLLCWACLCVSPATLAAELFGPAPIRVEVGQSPALLSSADLDGDGNLDLAVPNFLDASVTILLGDGTGSFVTSTEIDVGNAPIEAAVGEFNGDGFLDLAVTNSGLISGPGTTVSILLGDGTGGFVRTEDIEVGLAPFSIAVGEFNDDGATDLAVVNTQSDSVSILTGDGLGRFVRSVDIDVGLSPFYVAVAEFNSDGTADLAVVNANSDTVTILIGDGAGGFAKLSDIGVGRSPEFVVAADLNGDGVADLGVANTGGGLRAETSVSILLGDGLGGFARLPDVGEGDGAFSLAVGDFNGDDDADLVVATAVDALNLLLGDGLGSFASSASIEAGVFPVSAVVGEFNGDGVSDLAVSNNGDDSVSMLAGDGFGGFVQGVSIGVDEHPVFAAVEDFNGDGAADLSVANRSDNSLSILLGDGLGDFVQAATVGVGNTPRSVAANRFDANETADLAVANFFGATVNVLLGDGGGGFTPAADVVLELGLESVVSGELNGDGAIDLAVTNGIEQTVSVLLGDGLGGFARAPTIDAGARIPRHVAVGEFNGDDLADLVITDTGSPGREGTTVGVLLGDGAGGFSPIVDVGVGDAPTGIAVGKFDGNGTDDLAVVNLGAFPQYQGSVTILLGDGRGGFSRSMDIDVGIAPASIAIGDFNGDAIADAVVTNAGIAPTTSVGTTVSILIGNGAGGFVRTADAGVQKTPQSVVVGEFNGDIATDLAVVNSDSNSVSLLFNQMLQRIDVNGSNRIDGFDIVDVGRLAGVSASDPAYRRNVDVDLNAIIDGDDLVLVSEQFGELSKQASPLRPVLDDPLPADPDTITLQPAESTGDLLTVDVLVNDRNDPTSAADFSVTFGPTDGNPVQVLEVAGFDRGNYLSGGAGQLYEVDTRTPGRVGVRVSRLPAEDLPGAGERALMSLFFRARREGEAELDFAAFQRAGPTLLDSAGREVGGISFIGGVEVEVDASSGGPTGQRIGFAPEVLNFEELPPGTSRYERLRISNLGFSELELFGVESTLPEITSFFDSPLTVPAFGYVELTVEFAMSRPGVFSGNLVIESNDPERPDSDGDGHGEIRVPVEARSGPDLAVAPLQLAFSRVTVGDVRVLPVRITNLGSATLTLTGFVSADPHFLPRARFASLAAGESGNIDVRFGPDSEQEYLGRLTLNFDGPSGKTVIVSLKGTGHLP